VYATRRGLKVPSVINLPIGGAIEVLQRSGFEYQVPVGVSEGVVTGQSLPPGAESKTDKPIVRLSVAPRRAAIDAGPVVVLDTAKGRIELEMYPKEAPKTVEHILALVRRNFYNGQHIHRVAPGFVVQFGDPLTRDLKKRKEWGTGGSGKPVGVSEVKHLHKRGSVALAHRGDPNSGDSQMYIAFGPQPRLDTNFTVFGQVILGMDVAQRLEVGDEIKRASVKGETSPRR
jgi:cyclophilin family peptidyl-prolyl cis-trans isomerase